MKVCYRCDKPKHHTEFAFRNKKKNKKGPYCKECKNIYTRKHYSRNKLQYKTTRIARRAILYKHVTDYLKKHPCVDCGETDLLVLEFDHVRGKKIATISRMIELTSLAKIKEEIKKCQVRCANCHRRKTAKDQKWKKTTLQKKRVNGETASHTPPKR